MTELLHEVMPQVHNRTGVVENPDCGRMADDLRKILAVLDAEDGFGGVIVRWDNRVRAAWTEELPVLDFHHRPDRPIWAELMKREFELFYRNYSVVIVREHVD